MLRYVTVELPAEMFNIESDGTHNIKICRLERMVGKRTSDYTIVHVRGSFHRSYGEHSEFGDDYRWFAGYVAITAKSNEYDLDIVPNRVNDVKEKYNLYVAIIDVLRTYDALMIEGELEGITYGRRIMGIDG